MAKTRRHPVGGGISIGQTRHHNSGGTKPGRNGPRHMSGGIEGSMQHLASRLAKARTKKQAKAVYGRALR